MKIAKFLAYLLSSEKGRKFIGTIILIIISPFIFLVLVFIPLQESLAENNKSIIDNVFNSSNNELLHYDIESKELMNLFNEIDIEIDSLEIRGNIDILYIKSVYFVLYFSDEINNILAINEYVDKYFDFKTEVVDDEELEYYVPVSNDVFNERVFSDFDMMYEDVNKLDLINEVYDYLTNYEIDNSINSSSHELVMSMMDESLNKEYVGGTYASPFIDGWEDKVTSEFGYRENIILPDGTITDDFHTGMDLGAPKGTPILAINDGEVIWVESSNLGLGIFCIVDHGGGNISVYGHNSKNLVYEGQIVKKGDVIAEVGSTGYSTGNHLHLQVYEKGEIVNPKDLLY